MLEEPGPLLGFGEQLLEAFSLKRISKAGAIFDTDKLAWICGDYIRRMSVQELTAAVLPYCIEAGLVGEHASAGEELQQVVAAFQERFTLYSDFAPQAAGMFGELPDWDKKARKALAADGAARAVATLAGALEDCTWPPEDFMSVVKRVAGELEVGLGKVMKPVRAALTGTLGGPELDVVIRMLGRERSLKRLREFPAPTASE